MRAAASLGETQMYGEGRVGEKSCDTASGSELIFQIYLSGNGLEPSEPLQMALGELEWNGWERWGTAELYYHSSLHVCCPCFGLFLFCQTLIS